MQALNVHLNLERKTDRIKELLILVVIYGSLFCWSVYGIDIPFPPSKKNACARGTNPFAEIQ